MLGVAEGANGGDLLFLELCEELDIPTQMMLALQENRFVEQRQPPCFNFLQNCSRTELLLFGDGRANEVDPSFQW
jgi:hypothetical protein